MPNNYPRYVRSLKNSLFYERSWPSRLKHLGRPRFTHPLRLKLGQYTDAELHRAYAAANDEFDLQLKLMENSGSTVFTETEIEKAATAPPRKQRRWENVFAYIVEQSLSTPNLLDVIHDGLDRYWADRRERGIKVQSIRRE